MKKKIIFLSIFILLLIAGGVGIFYFTQSNRDAVTFADGDAKYKTETKEAPLDGTLPLEHNSYDNLAYVLWVLEHEEHFSSTTNGTSVSVGQTQVIYNHKVVNGDEQLVDTVTSGLVSLGKQKYFKDGKVLIRDYISKEGDQITWKQDDPECITFKGFISRYGSLPTYPSAYIICKDTILEISETIQLEDGQYSISVTLNPNWEYAPFWYRREVSTNASSLSEPIFSEIKLEYIFDANWRVHEIKTKEKYSVTPKVAPITVNCDTNISEKFDYEHYELDADAVEFFNRFKDLTPSDGAVEPSENTPLSYITGSLLGGSNKEKTFDIFVKINDKEIKGKLALNITDLNDVGVKLSLGDLQIIYQNKTVYIDYHAIKLKGNVDEVKEVITPLIDALILKNMGGNTSPALDFDVNQIMNDLNNAQVIETEDHVQLNLSLNLMVIDLPLTFDISKNGNELDLLSITSDILSNPYLSVVIEKNEAIQFAPIQGEYQDVKHVDFIIDDIVEIIKQDKVAVDFSFSLEQYIIQGNIYADLSENLVKVELDVVNQALNFNEHIELLYKDSYFFVTYRNIKIKITKSELIHLIKEYLPDLSAESKIDFNQWIDLLFEVDFKTLLSNVVFEENHIGAVLDISQFQNAFSSISVDIYNTEVGLDIALNMLDIQIHLDTTKTETLLLNEAEYADVSGYIELIKYFLNLTQQSFRVEMNGTLNVAGQEITLNGTIDLLRKEDAYIIDASMTIGYADNEINVNLLLTAKDLYITLYGQTFKFNLDTLNETIQEMTKRLGIELPEIEMTHLQLNQLLEILNTIQVSENQVELNLETIVELLGIIRIGYLIEGNQVNGTIESDILKTDLVIRPIEGRVVEVPTIYYTETDVFHVLHYVEDIITIVKNKRVSIGLSGIYEGISMNGNVYAEWDADVKVKADLTIEYNEEKINVILYYVHHAIYLKVNENIKVKVTVEELLDIVKDYLPQAKGLEQFHIGDIVSMLKEIKITDSMVEVLLDFSKFLPELSQVKIELLNTEVGFDVALNLYDIQIHIDTTKTDRIVWNEADYVDLSNYLKELNYILSLLFKKSIHISFGGEIFLSEFSNALPKDLNISIISESYIDLVLRNGTYAVDGKLIVDIASTRQEISFQIVDEVIYITYGNFSLRLTFFEISGLISHIKEVFQLGESNFTSLDSITELLNLITLDETEFTLDLSHILNTLSSILVSMQLIYEENAVVGTSFEISNQAFRLNMVLEPSSRTEIVIPQANLSCEDVKNFITSIGNIITGVQESDGLTFNLDMTVYGISLLGTIQLTKSMDVYADFSASVIDLDGQEYRLSFTVAYVEQQLYVSFNGIDLVFESADFMVILNTVEELIGPILEYIKKLLSSMSFDFIGMNTSKEESVLRFVLQLMDFDAIQIETSILKDSVELRGKISEHMELNALRLTYGLEEIPALKQEYLDVSHLISMFENLEKGVASTGQISVDAMGYNILLPYQMQFKLDLIELIKGQNLFDAIELELVIDSEFYSPIILTIVQGVIYLDSMDTKFKYQLPRWNIGALLSSAEENKESLNIANTFMDITKYLNGIAFEVSYNSLMMSFSSELSQTLNEILETLLGVQIELKDISLALNHLTDTTADFEFNASVNALGLDVYLNLSTKTTASDYVSHLTETDKELFLWTTDFKEHPFAKRLLDILTMVKGIVSLDYSGDGQKFNLNIPLEVDNGLIKSCVVTGDLGIALDLQGILDGNDLWSSFKVNAKINIKAETKLFVKININVWVFYIGDGYLYLVVDGTAAGIGFKISEMIIDLKSTLAEGLATSSDEVSTIYLNDLLNRIMNGFTTEQTGTTTTLRLAPAAVEVVHTLWRSLVDMTNEQIASLNVSALTSLINSISNFNMDVTGFTLVYSGNDQNQLDHLKVVLSGYRHGTYTKTELPITITASGKLDASYFDSAIAKANEDAYITAKSEMAIAREKVNALGEFKYTPEFYAQAKEVQNYLDSMSELAKASYSSTYPSEMISYYEQLAVSEENLKHILETYNETGFSGLDYEMVLGCYDAYQYFRKNEIVLTEAEFDLYVSIYNTMALESLLDFANRVNDFVRLEILDFEHNSLEILEYRNQLNALNNEYYMLSSSYKEAFKNFYSVSYEKLMQLVEEYDNAVSIFLNEKIYEYISNTYTLEEAQMLYINYDFEKGKTYGLDHSKQTVAWDLLTDFIYMNYVNELDKQIGKAIEGGIISELVVQIPQLENEYQKFSNEFKTYFRYDMEKLRSMLEPAQVKFVEETKELLDQFELAIAYVNYGFADAQKAYYYDYSKLVFTEMNYAYGVALKNYFTYASETELSSWYNDADAFTKFKILAYAFDFMESVNDPACSKEELQAKFEVLADSSKNFYVTKYVTGIWGSKKVHDEIHSFAEIFIKASNGFAYTCYQAYLQKINA